MHNDFLYEFPGFGSCPSRCHIRILSGTGMPVVVIVSQVKTQSGTSVMNACEIIRSYAYDYLAKQRTERLKADTADELSGMDDILETTKKILYCNSRLLRSGGFPSLPLLPQIFFGLRGPFDRQFPRVS